MKNLVTYFAILLLAISTQACSQFRHTENSSIIFGTKPIKGSKNYVTKDIRIEQFTKLNLAGSFKVTYTQKPGKPKLEVYTSDNIIDLLDIHVEDNALMLGFKKNTSVSYDILEVRVSSETLNGINVAGSGEVDLANGLKTDDLKIHVAGSGNVLSNNIRCSDLGVSIAGSGDIEGVNITCSNLEASIAGSGEMQFKGLKASLVTGSIAGSGDVTLEGKADEANYRISGSGDMSCEGLAAKKVSVKVAGSGDVKCHALDFLKVSISGSGNVGYKGNPELDTPKKGLYKL